MPSRTATTSLSGVASLDAAIVANGFGAHLEPSFPLADIVENLQHRSSPDLNAAAVRRYKAMFKAGSTCPPIGVTRDGVSIWGKHRTAGALAAGRDSLPAVVLDIDGVGRSKHVTDQLLSLAVEENAKHGVPYTSMDRNERCRTLLDLNYSSKSIQATLGLTAAQVSKIKREQDAEARLTTLGLAINAVPHNVIGALGGPRARALNDGPFRQLVDLIKDAKLTASEINVLAEGAKTAGSDAAATQLLNDFRTDQAQRIADVAVSGKAGRPSPIGRLRDALNRVVGLCDASLVPATYKDHNPATQADTVQLLNDAIACLQGILAVQ